MTTICKYYYVKLIGYEYFKYTRSIEPFENDDLFEFLNITRDEFLNFLEKNKYTGTLTKILFNEYDFKYMNKIIQMSDQLSPMIKIFCVNFCDWWDDNTNLKINHPDVHFYISNAFYYSRIRYIVCTNYKTLGFFLNKNLEQYKRNIISWDLHNCYDSSFVNFNYYPLNKILVSGAISLYSYPERSKLINFNNVCQKIKGDDVWTDELAYSKYLNQYICCFSTSVYPYNITTEKYEYSGLILLKTYEILGSGSLLLSPLTEKYNLSKIGLIEDVNCMFIDMTDDTKIQEKIDFILDEKNRIFIDNIRKNGQDHGKTNLNSKQKYKILKELIINSE
jgi:hypothetical protein